MSYGAYGIAKNNKINDVSEFLYRKTNFSQINSNTIIHSLTINLTQFILFRPVYLPQVQNRIDLEATAVVRTVEQCL